MATEMSVHSCECMTPIDPECLISVDSVQPASPSRSRPGSEAEPVEGLVLADLDLGREAGLGPRGADVRDEGEVGLPLLRARPSASRA